MSDLVASRLRQSHVKTECLYLSIGYSKTEREKGFSKQLKIPATNDQKEMTHYLFYLFDSSYQIGKPVRQVSVGCTKLVQDISLQLDLFTDPYEQLNQAKLNHLQDKIREKYGFSSLMYASSLLEGATAKSRATKIGGH